MFNDLYLFPGSLANYRLKIIPNGGMVAEPDEGRGDLVPQLVCDDLHIPVPGDSNTAGGSSQIDADGSSIVHLDLDEVGGLEK